MTTKDEISGTAVIITDSEPHTSAILGRFYECRQNKWSRIQFYYNTDSFAPSLPAKNEEEVMALLERVATDLMMEGELIIHTSSKKQATDRLPTSLVVMFRWK